MPQILSETLQRVSHKYDVILLFLINCGKRVEQCEVVRGKTIPQPALLGDLLVTEQEEETPPAWRLGVRARPAPSQSP